jgi:hypothetical protein
MDYKEGKDEKIRKEIIEVIESLSLEKEYEYVAWLEKQKKPRDYRKLYKNIAKSEWFKNAYEGKSLGTDEKQKPVTDINPSEFEARLSTLLKQFETLPKEDIIDGLKFYLNVVENDGTYKEQKPKWSEEDEEMKRAIIDNIFILKKMFRQEEMQTDYNRMIEWLKSLKERMGG